MPRLNPLRDALHHTVAIVCMAIIALLAACSCGSIHTRTTWEHGYNFDNGNPHYGHYKKHKKHKKHRKHKHHHYRHHDGCMPVDFSIPADK